MCKGGACSRGVLHAPPWQTYTCYPDSHSIQGSHEKAGTSHEKLINDLIVNLRMKQAALQRVDIHVQVRKHPNTKICVHWG